MEMIMSLFDDIGNFVSDAVHVAEDVVNIGEDLVGGALSLAGGLATQALSVAFPLASIALSFANQVTQMVGQAVNTAMDELVKVAGMPKFIAEQVAGLVKDVVSQLTQQSHSGCDEAVKQHIGGDLQSFG